MSASTSLAKVKIRCGIAPADVTYDDLLNFLIGDVAGRFDAWTQRRLQRVAGATSEFNASMPNLEPDATPIETVTKFELKDDEVTGWVEVTPMPKYLCIGNRTMVQPEQPLGSTRQLLRMTYTGGYVFPLDAPGPGQTALPSWIEEAAVVQVAHLWQLRDKINVSRVDVSTGVQWSIADYVWEKTVRWKLGGLRRTNYLGHA